MYLIPQPVKRDFTPPTTSTSQRRKCTSIFTNGASLREKFVTDEMYDFGDGQTTVHAAR